jgi:UDP-glucose 4-epimerase
MNILITGGSGFIGSHIVDKLSALKHKVRILDLKPPYQKNIEFIRGDFLSRKDLKKAIKDIDVIYHIGGFSNIDYVKDNPVETVRLNILGTAELLNAARKNNVKRFIFASSVYINDSKGHIYTTSKISSEMLCKNFFTLYGLPYTILRYGTVYGPRSRMVDVISRFVETAFYQNKIFIYGNGNQKRNFIFVEDLAEASTKILKKIGENKTYIIADSRTTSIKELANIIRRKFDNKPKIIRLPTRSRVDDYGGKISGVNQTIKELNWKPKYSLEKGIEKFINWYSKQNKNI